VDHGGGLQGEVGVRVQMFSRADEPGKGADLEKVVDEHGAPAP